MKEKEEKKEIVNRNNFMLLLPSLSLEQIMHVEFRYIEMAEKQMLVTCKDVKKKMYCCNVCQVVQYGDKNLFSHLKGRKHSIIFELVHQIFMPKQNDKKNSGTQNVKAKASSKPTITKPVKRTEGVSKAKQSPATTTSLLKKSSNLTQSTNSSDAIATSVNSIKPNKQNVPCKPNLGGSLSTQNKNITAVECQNLTGPKEIKTKPKASHLKKGLPPNTKAPPSKTVLQNKGPTISKKTTTATSNNQLKSLSSPSKESLAQKNLASVDKEQTLMSGDNTSTKSLAQVNPIKTNKTELDNQSTKKSIEIKIEKDLNESWPFVSPTIDEEITEKNDFESQPLTRETVSNVNEKSLPKPNAIAPIKITLQTKNQIGLGLKRVPDQSIPVIGAKDIPNLNTLSKTIIQTTKQTQSIPVLERADIVKPKPSKTVNKPNTQCVSNLKPLSDKSHLTKANNLSLHETNVLNTQDNSTESFIQHASHNENVNSLQITLKKEKIFCTPLSKLISPKPKETHQVALVEEVIVLDDDMPDNQPIYEAEAHQRGSMGIPHVSNEIILAPSLGCMNQNNKGKDQGPAFKSAADACELPGLLGVEYVIKICRNANEKSPRYECSLCEVVTDGVAMQNHLLGYGHRLKYCEKHFPTAIRQYRQYMSQVPEHEIFKIMDPLLHKLALAIEKHHGRETVSKAFEYNYNKNRFDILLKAASRKHASEMAGPSFSHIFNSKDVDLLIQNKNNYKPSISGKMGNPENSYFDSSVYQLKLNDKNVQTKPKPRLNVQLGHQPHINNNEPSQFVDDETHKKMVENFLKLTQKGSNKNSSSDYRNRDRYHKRGRSRSRSQDRKKRCLSPVSSKWFVERKSISPLRDGDIWQAYRHMVDLKVRDLDLAFDVYKSDPEEHPLYNEEWRKFWKQRKDELIATGINHRTYDYQPEWIFFFNSRLDELYEQDVENIKIQCRERLCLPLTNDELPNIKYHVHNHYLSKDVTTKEPERKQSVEASPPNTDLFEDFSVIPVLRILTALEEHLGSLGPCVTQMLSKALQLDKYHPDKVSEMILTLDNCGILETAREKLKGLIISKILDSSKEGVLKKVINDIGLLLKHASQIRKSQISTNKADILKRDQNLCGSIKKLTAPTSYIQEPKVTTVDKTELVTKLVSTLISQENINLNKEQLEKIAQVYSFIEEKKRNQDGHAEDDVLKSLESLKPTGNSYTNTMPTQYQQMHLINNDSSIGTNIFGDFSNRNMLSVMNNQSSNYSNPTMLNNMNRQSSSVYSSATLAHNNLTNFNNNINNLSIGHTFGTGERQPFDGPRQNLFSSNHYFGSNTNFQSAHMNSSNQMTSTNNNGNERNFSWHLH